MAKGAWDQESQGATSTFSRNKDLADAQGAASTYDDSSIDYDSTTVYYDGYDPTDFTPEGENRGAWSSQAQGSSAAWQKVSE